MPKTRIDQLLVARGLVESRAKAQALVMAGLVFVGERKVAKAGEMVIGQGSQALPRIVLRVQGEAVQAVGVEGLIYGREVNIL